MTDSGNDRLAYSLDDVARLLGGVARRYVETLVADRPDGQPPRLRSIKLGRRRLVPAVDLEAFLEELRREEPRRAEDVARQAARRAAPDGERAA